MTGAPGPHVADCPLCRRQLASPEPFHEDLCHMIIAPGGGRDDDLPVIQCPHIAVPGHRARMCQHHLDGARDQWRQLTARTAPFN